MGASAGGFLYGQQGTKITSVVTFDARTRSGLSVTNQTGTNTSGPNVVFGIASTDVLTSLVYRNGLTNSKVTVIGTGGLAGATATNAIVSYDANTGLVASVLPYTAAAERRGQCQDRRAQTVALRERVDIPRQIRRSMGRNGQEPGA